MCGFIQGKALFLFRRSVRQDAGILLTDDAGLSDSGQCSRKMQLFDSSKNTIMEILPEEHELRKQNLYDARMDTPESLT